MDVAESILHDYQHGFERVDDVGGAGIVGIGCIVGECGGFSRPPVFAFSTVEIL